MSGLGRPSAASCFLKDVLRCAGAHLSELVKEGPALAQLYHRMPCSSALDIARIILPS